MKSMTRKEWTQFIQEGTKTGKLVTTYPDGRPHCVPVWCVVENEQIVFMTMRSTVKARHIARDNRVCMAFDSDTFPYDFVTVEGTAAIEEWSVEKLLPLSTKIAARYVPPDRAEEYGRRNAAEGEVVVIVTPTKVISAKRVAD